MDSYVIASIHPFVFGQEINIYIEDKYHSTVECVLEDIPQKIYKICEDYKINKVHFYGGQLYALKFKDMFVSHKFGKRNIEVHIH